MAAWKAVPHYGTNSPFFAHQLARLAARLLADEARPTILELGAGSGKFAARFLAYFSRLFEGPFRYRATDFCQSNLDFLAGHPRLTTWLAQGTLELALFDASRDQAQEVDLIISNYLLGTLPQDLFQVDNGRLFAIETEPATFPAEVARQPVSSPYQHDHWNAACLDQARRLRNGAFLFPVTAAGLWQRLGQTPWLASDKGFVQAEEWTDYDRLPVVRHGNSLSMPVDFALLAATRPLPVSAPWAGEARFRTLLLGGEVETSPEMTVVDLIILWDLVAAAKAPPEVALALTWLGECCPHLVQELCPLLRKASPGPLLAVLGRAEEHLYDLPEGPARPARSLAVLFHLAGHFEKALEYYGRLEATPKLQVAMARCYQALGQTRPAAELVDLARQKDPSIDVRLPRPPEQPLAPPTAASSVSLEPLLGWLAQAELTPRQQLAYERLARE
ncbi:MAG: class I SAM-dependent methyltransferase [Candidatus Eremiobacteraeota bacterium]|nr:class I SAM-dependent methyltransferase [Candidatus Eremiobacteraeota bacterium]